jgi:hypothetical protein
VKKLEATRAIFLIAPLLLCGCFSYVQVPLDTNPVGEDVRLYVSRQGLAELPEATEHNGPILMGKVLREENERLVISVPIARREEGFFVSQIGQEVGVRRGEIVQLEMRKLNRTNTALFVAGTGLAAAGVVYWIIDAAARPDTPAPPGQEEFRIPLFAIPVR